MESAEQELVSAVVLEKRGILPKVTALKMARLRLIPCYTVGAKRRGIRFRVAEVLTALRRPALVDDAG